MTSRTDTLDQLNHIIDTTFSSVENFEPFDRYTTLQSFYTARHSMHMTGGGCGGGGSKNIISVRVNPKRGGGGILRGGGAVFFNPNFKILSL